MSNLKLDQGSTSACAFYALFNLFELQGHTITQKQVEAYYAKYLKTMERDASNIPSLCEYMNKNPIQGFVPRWKILYNKMLKTASGNFFKQEERVGRSIKENHGVIASLHLQNLKQLPVKNGFLVNNGEGFTGDNHAVVLTYACKGVYEVENSWKSLPNFKIQSSVMNELCRGVYQIIFMPYDKAKSA